MNLKDYPGAVGALTMGADRRVISPAVLKKVVGGKAKVVSIEEL